MTTTQDRNVVRSQKEFKVVKMCQNQKKGVK